MWSDKSTQIAIGQVAIVTTDGGRQMRVSVHTLEIKQTAADQFRWTALPLKKNSHP